MITKRLKSFHLKSFHHKFMQAISKHNPERCQVARFGTCARSEAARKRLESVCKFRFLGTYSLIGGHHRTLYTNLVQIYILAFFQYFAPERPSAGKFAAGDALEPHGKLPPVTRTVTGEGAFAGRDRWTIMKTANCCL